MGRLTDEQKIEIVNKYVSGQSGEKLALEYGVRSQSIYSILKFRNIPKRHRKYHVNESCFNDIESEGQAYWLGYLFAEGSLDVLRYGLSVKIGAFDSSHLESLKSFMGSEHPIKIVPDKNAVVLKIGSKTLSKRLQEFNFGTGKSMNIRMPELDPYLNNHFIRGFFDGDGWLSQRKNGSLVVGFASCSRPLLESFQNWFSEQTERKTGSIICRKRSHIKNQNDNFRLQYGGKASPMQILDLIYAGSTIKLSRKWEIYKSL